MTCAPARSARVGHDRELDPLRERERHHRARPREHGLREVGAALIEDARAPRDHVDAVAAVNVGHRSRRAERVLLGAEGQRARRRKREELAGHVTEAVVRRLDAAGPRREAAAH